MLPHGAAVDRDPLAALKEAGAEVHVISKKPGQITAANHFDKAGPYDVDKTLDEVSPDEYDAVLLPGGALNADNLRVEPSAQAFVKGMQQEQKPFAVICHAPWLLVSAGLVTNRRLTSYHTIADDLRNAGADWVDEPVVVDGNWVTSRQPDDIPEFNKAMIELFAKHKVS